MLIKNTNSLIVQKYGGATLATPEKIKQVARRISELSKTGKKILVVVSAMGKTTNDLLSLASAVSRRPKRRELDMLLSTGERISMSLLSLALNDLGCESISFTGSQAGILTSDSHQDAMIIGVQAPRVEQALQAGKIVVIAGFQGVCPQTKEITTLGRGGSDITAIAMASALDANHCQILKDVDAICSADPKIVENAIALPQLHYRHLLEITYWGSKVLHYRSVELAAKNKVNLFVGAADPIHTLESGNNGTWIKDFHKKDLPMLESNKVLSINSHERVLLIESDQVTLNATLRQFQDLLAENDIASPQITNASQNGLKWSLFVTGPTELLQAIQEKLPISGLGLNKQDLSSVTLTCTGVYSNSIHQPVSALLEGLNIHIHCLQSGAMSLTVYVDDKDREKAIHGLHALVEG